MRVNWGRAILGGLVGALVFSAVGLLLPYVGLPPGNPADMLGDFMGQPVVGWLAHLAIGAVLGVIYAAVAPALPGPPVARGALYSLAPWLLAMVAVMPMMGMPVFAGSAAMAVSSLIGHLAYGAVLGALYGEPAGPRSP